MAKSRLRGGAKAHRKRVQKRNEKIGIQKKKVQQMFSKMYEEKMSEVKEKLMSLSSKTETDMTTEETPMFEPEIDSAGFTYEDNFIQETETQSTSTEGKGE